MVGKLEVGKRGGNARTRMASEYEWKTGVKTVVKWAQMQQTKQSDGIGMKKCSDVAQTCELKTVRVLP